MVNVSIARRYARALLSVALETNSLDAVQSQLAALAALFQASAELADVLSNPSYSREDRQRVVDAVTRTLGGLAPVLANTLRLLNDRNRLAWLPDIARAFRDMADAQAGRVRGRVISAVPLPPELVAQVAQTLKTTLQREVVLEARVDPDVLGGVATQVGSTLFDGTLRTQLDQMRRALLTR